MLQQDSIRALIRIYIRVLSVLKEQKALFGPLTPPYIILHIEDTEDEIARLKVELANLPETPSVVAAGRPGQDDHAGTDYIATNQPERSDIESLVAQSERPDQVDLIQELAWLKDQLIQPEPALPAPGNYARVGKVVRILDSLLFLWNQGVAITGDLAEIGLPGFRPDGWFLPDDRLLGFVKIEEGKFLMGSDPDDDRYATKNEQPQHILHLPTYYISRYPVTVAQYRLFLEDSDHQSTTSEILENRDDHPVTNVNWFDAMSYCHWLTQKLQEWIELPKQLRQLFDNGVEGGRKWIATLPSEAEWEKAARGLDGRKYPWGDRFDQAYANCCNQIQSTTLVGKYIKGISPFGVRDMSGNVAEWTRSVWGKGVENAYYRYPYHPDDGRELLTGKPDWLIVIRGGGFNHPFEKIRCAYRAADYPNRHAHNRGFRVVLSTALVN